LGHLREVRPNGSFRPGVIDILGITIVNLAGPERAMLTNDVVDGPLMWGERVEALLSNLGSSIRGGVGQDVVGDALVILAIGRAGGRSKHADCQPGVAGGRVGDLVELVVGNDVLVEPPFRASTQDVV